MHKLDEVKARRQTIGTIKCIWKTKRGTLLSLLFWRKLALSRFRLGPSIFLKNRTILLPTYEFHQKHPQRFNTSQPQPRSHVCAVACLIWRFNLILSSCLCFSPNFSYEWTIVSHIVTTIDTLRMVAFVRPHVMKSNLCRKILNTTSTMINK